MTGGLSDKLGNWYEQDYVILLWLRLLAERVQSVIWEPKGDDECGVDMWTLEDGNRVAHQCKLRESGQWTTSTLVRENIPKHARFHLERENGAHRYHLVSTANAPVLAKLLKWARGGASEPEPPQKAVKLSQAFGFDPSAGRDTQWLRGLLRRVELYVLNQNVLEKQTQDHACQLAGGDSEKLLEGLASLHSEKILGVELHKHKLLEKLPKSVRWRTPVDSRSLLEQARELAKQFVANAHERRRIEPPLAQAEKQELLELVHSGSAPRTILVHGAAGSGKSEVLAAAVDDWPFDQGIVLPILADGADQLEEMGISIRKLLWAVGDGQLTLLVDQLDQLQLAGSKTQTKLRGVRNLIREAHKLGCTVIVGCRTIDAKKETQLHQLLRSGESIPLEKIEVKGLVETEVSRVLQRSGIAWTELSPKVRKLMRRPVCLNIAQDLAKQGDWHSSRSVHELVNAWWRSIPDENEGLELALDALIQRMESDGTFAVDPLLLAPHKAALDVLLRARVLEKDERGRLSPVHQVLIDMRLASQLGECGSAKDVLERIGPLPKQAVHEARRLRFAVTIFANRSQGGADIIDQIFRSKEVRPLLKMALLLGIAGERADLPGPLVRVVLSWLDNPANSNLVAKALLGGNGGWMTACRDWLSSAWSQATEDRKGFLIGLLATVAQQEGDLVAELLLAWKQTDASVLDRAQWIFWQSPSDDSDLLFEMRMEAPTSVGFPHSSLDWPKLFGTNPKRTATILRRALEDMNLEDLTQSSVNERPLPRFSDFPPSALVAAEELWSETRDTWLALELKSLMRIGTGSGTVPPFPIVDLVKILSLCLAHLLEKQVLSWDQLVEQLPCPLRDLDGWLLLETGARLTSETPGQVEAAAEWLYREARFAPLRVGWPGRTSDFELLGAFCTTLGKHLSDDEYAKFEAWVLNYHDPWTHARELERLQRAQRHGLLWPNDQGLLAYRILPRLPKERLGLLARVRLEECNRKFGSVAKTMLAPLNDNGGLKHIRSVFPDDYLLQLSPEKWVEKLRAAPDEERGWTKNQDGTLGSRDIETLTIQLGCLAQANPRSFLRVAETIALAAPPFGEDVYATLLESLGRISDPGGTKDGKTWKALGENELAGLAIMPAFLRSDSCAVGLSRIVKARAAFDWPEQVLDRLVEIATHEEPEQDNPQIASTPCEEPLIEIQLNDGACMGLRALAALAQHHPRHHPYLLDTAARLVDRSPLARRAAAGLLAICCSKTDPTEARRLVLMACDDENVAASHECLQALFYLLDDPETPPEGRKEIQEILVGLSSSKDPQIANRGGHAAIALRSRERLDQDQLLSLLRANHSIREGAAQQLGDSLFKGQREPWMEDCAIELAKDKQVEVGDTILRSVTSPGNRDLLLDMEFLSRLLSTPAGRRNAEDILIALDEQATLEPVTELVLETAEAILSGRELGNPAPTVFSHYAEGQALGSLLARLVEECERRDDLKTRTRALDAWDRLIESQPTEVGPLIKSKTD